MMTRRGFIRGSVAGAAGAVVLPQFVLPHTAYGAEKNILVGSCGVGLKDAKAAGLDGVEVGVGGPADVLDIAKPETRERLKAEMKETGLVISSFMMGLFNQCPLASDPRGPAWLEQSIEAAADLKAGVILVAFFGKGSLKDGSGVKQADVDVVVERLKVAAPKAEKAGTILGVENTLPAADNVKILERVGSPAVKIYYDVFNLAGQGYDTSAEIRMLKDRIAIFHFKNGPDYLETGKVDFKAAAQAIKDIAYKGWIVLETSNPSKDRVADAKRNADYIRGLFA
jgi:sugar phosphate isomerase/epimerase